MLYYISVVFIIKTIGAAQLILGDLGTPHNTIRTTFKTSYFSSINTQPPILKVFPAKHLDSMLYATAIYVGIRIF